jgi:hypothetical protein
LDTGLAGSDPAEDDGILTAIKIHSTTSFGGELKPSVPCRKNLRHVKDSYSMKEILVGKINGHFRHVFPALLLGVSAGNWQRILVDESGMI